MPKGTRVVHCRKDRYDIYIGRPSIFGNPFAIGDGRDRDGVIKDFSDWLKGVRFVGYRKEQRERVIKAIPGLRGKVLGCWCKPHEGFKRRLLCHGQILAGMCDGRSPKEVE